MVDYVWLWLIGGGVTWPLAYGVLLWIFYRETGPLTSDDFLQGNTYAFGIAVLWPVVVPGVLLILGAWGVARWCRLTEASARGGRP